MEPVPQTDDEARPAAQPTPQILGRLWWLRWAMLPALLTVGLLMLKPNVATIHEGAPDTESFWRRPGHRLRKRMAAILETNVKEVWDTISGHPMKFKNKPRVRREWRTLSPEMKEKVVKAFWKLKTIPTLEGRKIYGENFNNHDDMLILHSCATTDPRCDEGHFGPQFMTFHRALLLKYELSLLAVDPSIEAMPYWNMAFDAKNGKYRHDPEKYFFTNHYIGNYTGTGINYQVVDGQFANWPVRQWTSEKYGKESYMATNKCIREEWFQGYTPSVCDKCCLAPSGCSCSDSDKTTTRVRLHDDCSPFVARWPQDPDALGPLGGTYEIVYTEEDFATCQNVAVVRSWMEWQDCIEMSTFLCGQRFHIVSGRPEFEGVFKDEILPEMKSRLLATGDAKALEAIRKLDDAMEQVGDAFTSVIRTLTKDLCKDYMLYGYLRERNFLGKTIEPKLPNFFHSQAHIKFGKDLLDVTTSPNEAAAFTGYHANIDRNSMTWMINAQEANPGMGAVFWQYPATEFVTPGEVIKTPQEGLGKGISGPFAIYDALACSNSSAYDEYEFGESPWIPGTLLHDVVNSGFPFFKLFDCEKWEKHLPPGITCDGGTQGYTHKEMLYWTSPERTPYTYDTLEHYYY